MALEEILDDLKNAAGISCEPGAPIAVAGGSINDAFRIESASGPLLLKVNARTGADMFAAEAEGLAALRDAQAVAVPEVYAHGATATHSYLALQWIELAPDPSRAAARLGRELAAQHARTSERFGWHRDNTIGSTPQPNGVADEWTSFLRERRLGYQLELAAGNGLPRACCARVSTLLGRLDQYFGDYAPRPSLLHGDLWGGNWGATLGGVPYIFDPAVYFGDREADLAMTRLFGGFGPAFYEAYKTAWPLAPGAERRVPLYNLYHLLNHFNLFGSGYVGQIERALTQLER